MIDKVQKIKEWISKEQDGLMDAKGNFEYPSDEGAFHILSRLDHYIDSLQEEPVSEDIEEAAINYSNNLDSIYGSIGEQTRNAFKTGAKWHKKHSWKSADGDGLPEIDREVIALLNNGKVVFAHRPSEYWDGKNIITGKVTRNYPKTYDKGGWNIPNVKYWLDCSMPKEIEL